MKLIPEILFYLNSISSKLYISDYREYDDLFQQAKYDIMNIIGGSEIYEKQILGNIVL